MGFCRLDSEFNKSYHPSEIKPKAEKKEIEIQFVSKSSFSSLSWVIPLLKQINKSKIYNISDAAGVTFCTSQLIVFVLTRISAAGESVSCSCFLFIYCFRRAPGAKASKCGWTERKSTGRIADRNWKLISVDFRFVIEIVTPVPINDYTISYTTDWFLATWQN